MTNKEMEIDNQFFNELADHLDSLFPKGECQERSQALVLNAFANALHTRYMKEAIHTAEKRMIGEVEKLFGKDMKYRVVSMSKTPTITISNDVYINLEKWDKFKNKFTHSSQKK